VWPVTLSFAVRRLFFAERKNRSRIRPSIIAGFLVVPALTYPVWYSVKFPAEGLPGQDDAAFGYTDLPIAMEAGHDYLPRMHYSTTPERYFHIRDWDIAVANTASGYATGDYTHMSALSRHYRYVQSVEGDEFLEKHHRFLVWNEPDQKWFEWRVLTDPQYSVRLLGVGQGSTGPLELYLVESDTTPLSPNGNSDNSLPASLKTAYTRLNSHQHPLELSQ
jgi:hypothetical protein